MRIWEYENEWKWMKMNENWKLKSLINKSNQSPTLIIKSINHQEEEQLKPPKYQKEKRKKRKNIFDG